MLKEGMSKSAIARKLGIARDTVIEISQTFFQPFHFLPSTF